MTAARQENASEPLSSETEQWLTRHVGGYTGPGRLIKFGFGQSNPTYRLETASRSYVLRRKPFGTLLPKAHAIEREYQVLRALSDTDVPVPAVYGYCDDPALLGAPFFIMEYIAGRIFHDQTLPALVPVERAGIFDAMNDAIARLHRVDPAAIGLSNFGRSDNFLSRQISLWSQQYRASETSLIPAMEHLIVWLPRNVPAEQPARIFHGDLRLDNLIFHPSKPEVVSVLDWELSTLGDPVADFAYNAMLWRVSPALFRGLQGLDFAALGIPDESSYVARYCDRVGRHSLPAWNFYLAFGLFRVASILQGVRRRAMDGNAASTDAEIVGARAAPLADIAWMIAQENNNRNLYGYRTN